VRSSREPTGDAAILRILLVDDHAIFREGLKLLLEDQPEMRVIGEASTGTDAVKQSIRLLPDVVIMDIKMPGMGGIDATREILKRAPSTRVIVLSMYSDTKEVTDAFRAGAQGYVLKESSGSELIDAVQAVRENRRYLSQKLADTLIDDYLDGKETADPLSTLSDRERQVLHLVVEGKSSKEIAVLTSLSPKTVETYRSRLMSKLSIDNLPGLVKFAIAQGLISLEPEA
jgi:DNA-binding NarL/FixJ family response regulator